MARVLPQSFFNRDTKAVAQDLLGTFLVRKAGNKTLAVMVTETEAYDGFDDKASHAAKGKTERTKVMFGRAGIFYVYLCYGMYDMLNVVTREHGYPSAVLIRGAVSDHLRLDGPGKLTKFLNIGRQFNGKKAGRATGLWFEDRGVVVNPRQIKKSARVGVGYAGPVWSKKKLRFTLEI